MSFKRRIRNFLNDERGGERDTLTTILILALVIVPLLLLLLYYRDEITREIKSRWRQLMGRGRP